MVVLVGRTVVSQVAAPRAAARVGLLVAAVSWPTVLAGAKLAPAESAAPGDAFHLRAPCSPVPMDTYHPLLHAAVDSVPRPPALEAVLRAWEVLCLLEARPGLGVLLALAVLADACPLRAPCWRA